MDKWIKTVLSKLIQFHDNYNLVKTSLAILKK